jgi:hypothetical protein
VAVSDHTNAVLATWSETSTFVRRICIALWGVSAGLLGFGIWGDVAGFWGDKPFLTNTVSALTGAAFGLPVALLVINRLEENVADGVEARAARRAASELAAAIAAIVPGGIPALDAFTAEVDGRSTALQPDGSHYRSSSEIVDYHQYADAVGKAIDAAGKLFGPAVRTQLAEVAAQWRLLSREPWARLPGSGQQQLSAVQAEEMTTLITGVTGDFLETWQTRGSELKKALRKAAAKPAREQPFGDIEVLCEFAGWQGAMQDYAADIKKLTDQSELFAG